jgi:hypothetical protein
MKTFDLAVQISILPTKDGRVECWAKRPREKHFVGPRRFLGTDTERLFSSTRWVAPGTCATEGYNH